LKALLVFLLSSIFTFLSAKELIVWSETDLPPIFIVEGEDKGKGYAQRVTKELQKQLPQYKHIVEENTIARSLKLLENTDYSCYSLLWSKQRAKYTLFSKPIYLTFPNGLIIRKEDKVKYLPYMNEENEIDLDKLFLDESLIFGRVNMMRFGKFIDEKIDKYSYSMNISYFNKQTNLIKMFASYNRVDYVIAYYTNIKYQMKKLNLSKKLEYIKIKGMDVHPAYIGCSKSKIGRDTISKINEFAIKKRDNQFLEFSKEYIDENQMKYLEKNATRLFKEYDKRELNKE